MYASECACVYAMRRRYLLHSDYCVSHHLHTCTGKCVSKNINRNCHTTFACVICTLQKPVCVPHGVCISKSKTEAERKHYEFFFVVIPFVPLTH